MAHVRKIQFDGSAEVETMQAILAEDDEAILDVYRALVDAKAENVRLKCEHERLKMRISAEDGRLAHV